MLYYNQKETKEVKKMDRIEMLNNRTRDFRNNMAVDPMKHNMNCGRPSFDRLNRETYKANNGRYWWER